jgi:hypothetical protein
VRRGRCARRHWPEPCRKGTGDALRVT